MRFREPRSHDFTSTVAVALQQTGLLNHIELGALHAFALHFERISLSPGAHLFEQGDDGNGWYLILSGMVAIVRDEEGEDHILDHLEAPDSFGEMALIDGAPRMATAGTSNWSSPAAAQHIRPVALQR